MITGNPLYHSITLKSSTQFNKLARDIDDFKKQLIISGLEGAFFIKMSTGLYESLVRHHRFLSNKLQLYHVSYEAGFVVVVYKHGNPRIPTNPNAIIGSHVLIYTRDNSGMHVLMIKEEYGMTIPGGILGLRDKELMSRAGIKINLNDAKLKLVRFMPQFPRLAGLFKSKDLWMLFAIKKTMNELENYVAKSQGKLAIVHVDDIKTKWMTKQVKAIVKSRSEIDCKSVKNAYDGLPGVIMGM